MSLDQLFKQKQGAAESEASGESLDSLRSRAEEDSAADEGSAKSRRPAKRQESNRKNATDDAATLPEKKRARRRLIGAVALVLAAVIGLPMVFDSEPKPSAAKIAIEIPSKESPNANMTGNNSVYIPPSLSAEASVASTAENKAESAASKSLNKTEEIVPVATAIKDKAVVLEKKVEAAPASVSAPVTPIKAPALLAPTSVGKPEAKPEAKSDTKLEAKPDTKKNSISDAERALALLEGRPVPEPVIAAKSDKPAASFAVQVAALNSPIKVRELQNKLKAANITSYTQKITTKTGEVSRIRVGPFASKAEAEKARQKLLKLGLNGSLVPN